MDHRRPNRLQPIHWNYSCRLAFRVAARGGEAEKETRSAIRSVFRADRATVHFNNGANNGQSHAHSGLLGGKEMIEHFLRPVLRQAGAEIAHTDFRAISAERTGSNDDSAFGGRERFDGVERIHYQVEQDLLNLDWRRFHLWQVVIHLGRNHAFAQQNVRTHQPQGIRDDGVEIKHAADNAFIFPHQRTNPAKDFDRALTVGHHVLQQLLQQNRVNVAALEKTSRGRGIVSDGGKRLIQFVRDRSGHFPHQRHAIQMCQLFALYLQLEVGLLLRADINRYPDKFQKTSVLVL